MAVNNLIRLVMHWTGYQEEGTTGFYLSGAPTASTSQLEDCLAEWDGGMNLDANPSTWSKLQGFLTAAQKWDRMQAYQYAVDSGPATSQADHGLNKVGTVNGTCAGLQQAVVATTQTGQPGRRKRGRLYMPGHCLLVATGDAQLSQANVDLVGGTTASMIAQAVVAFQSKLGTNAIEACVYSRASHSVLDMKTLRVDSRVDSQRRRAAEQIPARANTFNVAQT